MSYQNADETSGRLHVGEEHLARLAEINGLARITLDGIPGDEPP